MSVEVEVNGEVYEFPDDMHPDQIRGVMQKRFPQQPATPPEFDINNLTPEGITPGGVMSFPTDIKVQPPTEDNGKGRLRSAGESFMQGGGVGTGQSIQGTTRLARMLAAGGLAVSGDPEGAQAEYERQKRQTPQQAEAEIESDPLYQKGGEIAAGAKEAFQPNPQFKGEFLTDTIPGSAGQMVPTIAAGAVGGPLAGGLQYGFSSGQQGAEESVAAGDIEDADKVFLAYMGLGAASEAALGVPARVLQFVRQARKAGLTPELAGETLKRMMTKGVVRESLQEGGEQLGQNAVAQQTFDPERKTFQDVPENMAAGALLGGGAAGGAAVAGRVDAALDARRENKDFDAASKAVADRKALAATFPDVEGGKTIEVKGPFPDQNIALEPSIGGTSNVKFAEATEAPAAPVEAIESNESLIARTTPGDSFNQASAERAKKIKELSLSLKSGDVIIDEDGRKLIVRQVAKDGAIFASTDPNEKVGAEYHLAPSDSVQRNPKPAEATPSKTVETPAVTQFIEEFNDPNVKLNNAHSKKAGMGLKTLEDLKSILAFQEANKAFLVENKRKRAAGEPITPEDATKAYRLMMSSQYPREVIETATDSGAWSEERQIAQERPLGPRPLDWKKNPEVEKWIRKNAEKLGIELPAKEAAKPEAKEEMVTLYRGQTHRSAGGSYWTDKPETAARYGKNVQTVQVPKSVAEAAKEAFRKANAEKGTPDSFFLPDEWQKKATFMEKPPEQPTHDTDIIEKPKVKRDHKADVAAKKELTDLVHEWGERMGFVRDLNRYAAAVAGRIKTGNDTGSLKARFENQKVVKAAHEMILKAVGQDPAIKTAAAFADALPKFKKLIEEWKAKNPAPVDTAFDADQETEEEKQARIAAEFNASEEQDIEDENIPFRTEQQPSAFDRAITGDESAFDDLEEEIRNIYEGDEILEMRGRPNPHQVFTPAGFAKMFNEAYGRRDFEAIVNAVKASDVSVYKGFLRDLMKNQNASDDAKNRMEWMRAVFSVTTPPDAKKATPPPPPRPQQPTPPRTPPRGTGPVPPRGGATPPPRPPPTPPGPTPQRIKVDPLPGGGGKSPYKILEDFSRAIGKSLRILRMKKGGLGFYNPSSTTTAQRFASDLDTAAHELAGHWTDDKFGIGKPWVTPRTRSPYDTELAKFWPFGSVTPRSSLRYRRAEGIAEYIRAYVMNPTAAKAAAPNFSAYFERTVGAKALKDIQNFSDDVRKWAGEHPLIQGGLNFRMEPPSYREKLWNTITGRGHGFETGLTDKLRVMFDDAYHYVVKAEKMIREIRGEKVRYSQQFELMARLLSTHDSRMEDQFKNGLVPLRPGQATNRSGELAVQRIIDPVTGKPLTMEWLVGAFDTSSMEKFNADLKLASLYMVSQRTVEKAAQLGRSHNLTGMGALDQNDLQVAQKMLAAVDADPQLKAKLDEAARRYRLWAEKNIDMLVASGRISSANARHMKRQNQYYVDMHRLSADFDEANYQQRGGNQRSLTARDKLKRFKGSSLQINNVYENLLEQTDSIQREAHRNVVMNNFTDSLRSLRQLHGANLKDFDQFGRKVRTGDKHTIAIYKDGRKELWQFAPEIHDSLKGLGELGTNWLFSAIMAPSRFARYMITRGPSFMIRNPLRDTVERSVNSKSGSKPWDIFQGFSKEELSRYEVFGGGQFGNYITDKHAWDKELKRVARQLTKDPKNILLSPLKLKEAWEHLSEKSEKLGRIAEFRRAFEKGKKQIREDFPGLTDQEVDYEAALYAAGEARGLLDFAKAGTVMRHINQAIPFSNAAMRGIGKSIAGFKDNPAGYAMRWGLHVMLPTLALLAWNRRDDETWKEYLQLPAYRRDLFWNLKVGNYWMMFPKPHLLGVLAGGVERLIVKAMGEKHAFEGLAESAASVLPASNVAQAAGPLKAFVEMAFNYDSFRQKEIVPFWEKNLDMDLRKGTKYASKAGQGIAEALKMTGLNIDPRNLDYILNSMGGFGTIATSAGRDNTDPLTQAAKASGLFQESPGPNAMDVEWMLNWAKRRNENNNSDVKALKEMRADVYATKDPTERAKKAKALRTYATQLRNVYDK